MRRPQNLKNILLVFEITYLVKSKQSEIFFQIFVAFSEYLNCNCGHANKSASYFLIDHHWHKKVSAKEVHKSVLRNYNDGRTEISTIFSKTFWNRISQNPKIQLDIFSKMKLSTWNHRSLKSLQHVCLITHHNIAL